MIIDNNITEIKKLFTKAYEDPGFSYMMIDFINKFSNKSFPIAGFAYNDIDKFFEIQTTDNISIIDIKEILLAFTIFVSTDTNLIYILNSIDAAATKLFLDFVPKDEFVDFPVRLFTIIPLGYQNNVWIHRILLHN